MSCTSFTMFTSLAMLTAGFISFTGFTCFTCLQFVFTSADAHGAVPTLSCHCSSFLGLPSDHLSAEAKGGTEKPEDVKSPGSQSASRDNAA